MKRLAAVLLLLGCGLGSGARAAASPARAGWTTLALPESGSYALLYVPPGLDLALPAPLAVFLHGAGSRPEAWKNWLGAPADASGMVVIVPRSKGQGWEVPADEDVLREALALARAKWTIDPRRISVAGISAGGAEAVR